MRKKKTKNPIEMPRAKIDDMAGKALSMLTILALAACNFSSGESKDLLPEAVAAKDLASDYRGVLEAVSVANLQALDDETQKAIIDIDLLHELTATKVAATTLLFESAVVRPFKAFVVGVESAAISLDFIGFEDTDKDDYEDLLNFQIKQIIFVKNAEDDWIFSLQMADIGIPKTGDGRTGVDEINVYQYVSYDPDTAAAMSEADAVVYVNEIFKAASAAQRQ